MYCPRCGARVDAGFRWCPECGATLPPDMLAQPPPFVQHGDADEWINKVAGLTFVVILLLLSAILAYLIIGVPCSPSDGSVTVSLSLPSVSRRSTGDHICWDAVIDIDRYSPKDEKILWTEVRIVVKASDGSILDASTEVLPDAAAHADPPTPEFWYVDLEGDRKLGAGDFFKITGLDASYEGAHIQITQAGSTIGSSKLPTTFP